MGRSAWTHQVGVFPEFADGERFRERDTIVEREMLKRAGLPSPEQRRFTNLGNQELPAYLKKEEIQRNIRDNQISMIEGPTGSGKSTQSIQYALELGYPKIIQLVPRILPADNLAERVEEELASQLGAEQASELIGVRHSERSTGMGKQIEVMTPGTFLRVINQLEASSDEPLYVAGDEIHEKDFETELAVAEVARRLPDHPKWRLSLVSATLDSQAITDRLTPLNGRPIPSAQIEGRPHPVEHIERPDLTISEAYKLYGEQHDKTLAFTSGKAEIQETIDSIQANRPGNVRCDPLHARLSHEKKERATNAELSEGQRQVIVATNVAQSSITIPEMTLVITDGTTRRPGIDAGGVEGLHKTECTQDELIQQAGRAGRDVEGGTVVLVRPDDETMDYLPFDERAPQSPAQVEHTNISRSVLLTLSIGSDFEKLNDEYLIHPVPSQKRVIEAYETLYRLQAIDETNRVTSIGETMNQFPLRPELSRALVEAMQKNADNDTMQHLVAAMSAINAGGMPYFEKGVGEAWRRDIRSESVDDYMAQLDMFYATRSLYDGDRVDERALELRNYDISNTERAHRTFDKVMRTLGLATYDIDTTPPTDEQVRQLHNYLTAGLFDYAHQLAGTTRDGVLYRSIHDHAGSEDNLRELSDRGTYKNKDQYILGFPRWFEKKEKGERVEHTTVEYVIPTTKAKLARYAIHAAELRPADTVMRGDQMMQRTDAYLGSLRIDQQEAISPLISHTPESRQQLKEAAFERPKQTLKEMLAIKKELEYFSRRIPDDEQVNYFPRGIMTDEWLQAAVDNAISDQTDSIHTLDNAIRTSFVRNNISTHTWLSDEAALAILERSPDAVTVGETDYQLYYSHGKPIINQFNLINAAHLPDGDLCLADGREIKITYRIGKDTKRYSAQQIKEFARQQ